MHSDTSDLFIIGTMDRLFFMTIAPIILAWFWWNRNVEDDTYFCEKEWIKRPLENLCYIRARLHAHMWLVIIRIAPSNGTRRWEFWVWEWERKEDARIQCLWSCSFVFFHVSVRIFSSCRLRLKSHTKKFLADALILQAGSSSVGRHCVGKAELHGLLLCFHTNSVDVVRNALWTFSRVTWKYGKKAFFYLPLYTYPSHPLLIDLLISLMFHSSKNNMEIGELSRVY